MILPSDRWSNCVEVLGYYVACLLAYDSPPRTMEEVMEACCDLRNSLLDLASEEASSAEGDEYGDFLDTFQSEVEAAAEEVLTRIRRISALSSDANSAIAAGREPPDAPDTMEVVLTLGKIREYQRLLKSVQKELLKKNYNAAMQDMKELDLALDREEG